MIEMKIIKVIKCNVKISEEHLLKHSSHNLISINLENIDYLYHLNQIIVFYLGL